MRVTLVHNAGAGDEEQSGSELTALLEAAGHEVRYRSLADPGWRAGLRQQTGLVAVAGGDGTIREVFTELAGSSVTVAVVPVGSANNIAHTLGVADSMDVGRLARAWESGRMMPFDLGSVEAGGHSTRFVESFGGGVFAQVLERAAARREDVSGDEKVEFGLKLFGEVAAEAPAVEWRIDLDGTDLSGAFVAIEATNIRTIGPNIPLARVGDPGDGLLDVVLARDDDRAAMVDYARERLHSDAAVPPSFETLRGRTLRVELPTGTVLHVDDALWTPATFTHTAVCANDSRLNVLVPASAG